MPKHRASTPVECPDCGISINRKADLPRHRRTHASDKDKLKHHCPHPNCEYKTLQRSNLKTHLNVHSRERPHKCAHPGCEFSTADPGSLTRHHEKVHGITPKANSRRSSPSNVVLKETRRQRRMSPYPSSSVSSGSSPRSWSTLSTPPIPDLPGDFDQCPPSTLATENPKNNVAAYGTQLIATRPQINEPLVPDPFDDIADWRMFDRQFDDVFRQLGFGDGALPETSATQDWCPVIAPHPIYASSPSHNEIFPGVNDTFLPALENISGMPYGHNSYPAGVAQMSEYLPEAGYAQAVAQTYSNNCDTAPMGTNNIWVMQEPFQF